jgi:2-desacetyl-2-hydroxyethyl bacteriochlorophyllide A dehydrogenase
LIEETDVAQSSGEAKPANRAALYKGGHTFVVTEVPPPPVGAGEVAIDVAYCGICGTDMHVFHGTMDGRVGTNRIIGHEMSGRISATGSGVSGLAVGDPVVVRPLVPCGECPACKAGHSHICHKLKFLGLDSNGAMQSVWSVPQYTAHRIPEGVSLRNAALVEPLAVACHDVRRANLKAGERVVVIGGGPIGVLIGLVAQRDGADVTICEISEGRRAKAAKLGLTAVDAAAGDFVRTYQERWGGADVIFEVSGSDPGALLMTTLAATRGRIVMVGINGRRPPVDLFQIFWRELELIGARVYEVEDYERAIGLIAAGAFDFDAFITEVVDLSEIQHAFEKLDKTPDAMKVMLRIGAGE